MRVEKTPVEVHVALLLVECDLERKGIDGIDDAEWYGQPKLGRTNEAHYVRTRRRLWCVRVSRDVARWCHNGGQGCSKVHMLEDM